MEQVVFCGTWSSTENGKECLPETLSVPERHQM
jgi:hypothetical protein